MKWVIEDIFEEETKSLVAALEKNNIEYSFEPRLTFDLCIYRGSIEFVKRYNCHLDFDQFKCSNYYHHFGDLMFNDEYLFMTKACLRQNKRTIPWMVWNDKSPIKVFIRPDSGCKEFTGTTIGYKWFEKDLDIVLKDFPDDGMILISSVKECPEEFRAVIGPDGLISLSKHSYNGIRITSQFYRKIIEFAKTFHFPAIETFYTIDFCEVDGKVRIMEINSFESAGLYDINYDKVVKYINKYWSK